MGAQIFLPSSPSSIGVLVIHSWWGRTRSFLEFAEALADDGFVVAVSDLYAGKLATTEAQARMLRRGHRRTPMYRTLEADLAALRSNLAGDDGRVGVVGFSMGGHWAVWLSQRPEYEILATVLYYSARAGDFSRSQSEYLAHFAEKDPWVSAGARGNMERAIAAADRPYRSHDYPGTGHWFAEPDRSDDHCPEEAATALARTCAHLRRVLGHRDTTA